jgi:homoserine kinase
VVSEAARSVADRRVVVEVPATIANLGAGYDCLGMAIEMALVVAIDARLGDPGPGGDAFELRVDGEGAGELGVGRGNRFVEAFEGGLDAVGLEDREGVRWRIEMTNPIPLARGLGSSGAATVAGLLAAVVYGHPTGKIPSIIDGALAERGSELRDALLGLATRIEGHPDNVAPALLGGFVATAALADGIEAQRFDVPSELSVVLFIPDLRLSTAEMRRVLPERVPRADAAANLARVAVGVAGIAAGRADALRLLTEDRLHEPYRAAAFPQLPRLEAAARGAGAIGACLAGAGSAVAAFAAPEMVADVGDAMRRAAAEGALPGRIQVVLPRNHGARVLEDR